MIKASTVARQLLGYFIIKVTTDTRFANHSLGVTDKRGEVYAIIKEENSVGKLKSGIGYISMNSKYIKKK